MMQEIDCSVVSKLLRDVAERLDMIPQLELELNRQSRFIRGLVLTNGGKIDASVDMSGGDFVPYSFGATKEGWLVEVHD